METSRRLRLKLKKATPPQPELCNSPSPTPRKAPIRCGIHRSSFEHGTLTSSISHMPPVHQSTKDLASLLRKSLKSSQQDRTKLPEVGSHSPSPNNSSKISNESSANYARRMRRIRMQVTELAEMGLISSRGNEPLLSDLQSTQTPVLKSRMSTAEFWGHKEKMELIKKLGYTEAYREFEARQSVRRSRVLSPAHLHAEETLRQSCPVSPSVLFGVSKRCSTVSTANTTPEDQCSKPHITALNKIMKECDQFFVEKTAKRVQATPKMRCLHMRSQSEAELRA